MLRQRLVPILRWIAVLPGAALALFLVSAGNNITARLFVNTDSVLFQVWVILISTGAFVWAAARIAPAYPLPTAIVATMILCAWMGVNTWIGLTYAGRTSLGFYKTWEIWLMGIAGFVGACGTCIGLYLDERQRATGESTWVDM